MQTTDPVHKRMEARDAARRLMNSLTAGAAVAAVAGVGVTAYFGAVTIPGKSSSSGTASTGSSTSSTSSTSGSSSSASGLSSSSGAVSSSSSSGVAVSGGS